ncbi:hypothetical protein MBLNU230_g5249t1 [Neophaeotheca triangularis]
MSRSVDIKQSSVVDEADAGPVAAGQVAEWTPDEERKIVRRLDGCLITFLALGLFWVAVDQSNIGNALTSTFLEDLNMNTKQVNTGYQVLLAAIIVFELPSNWILQRTRFHLLLSGQMLGWGMIATFQSFITNYTSSLATRFLLGFFAAGYMPGGIFVITMWYKIEEYSSRVAVYYLGKTLSAALSALLAAGILNLEGAAGWSGWRWLFALEGMATLITCVCFFLFVPQRISLPRPLAGLNRWRYFNDREEWIIQTRLSRRGAEYADFEARPSFKELLVPFANFRIYLHIAISMLMAAGLHGLLIYSPSLIRGFGLDPIESPALASVGYFGNAMFTVGLAYLGEYTNKRSSVVMFGASWQTLFYSLLNLTPDLNSRWAKYALVSLTNVGGTTVHILNVGWLVYHTKTKTARGIYSA